MSIDLTKEQQASLARPRYTYSLAAKFFFAAMDLVTGKRTTLAKTKLIEMLASIPYRAWEIRQYGRTTVSYRNRALVKEARNIMAWGRDAQDNEYWHLVLINQKMEEDGAKDPWYTMQPIPLFFVVTYIVLTRIMALVSIRRAFLFNAEFEDHAEHVYAQFVEDHPEWNSQPVAKEIVEDYDSSLETWGDVFRRIGLDERDHMNTSFIFCGKPDCVVSYEGMPHTHTL